MTGGDLPEKVWLAQSPDSKRSLVAPSREADTRRTQAAYRWWLRFLLEGDTGLEDRSSRPWRSPQRTSRRVERRVERLRRRLKLGPVRIADRLGLAPSTVYRVLRRLGLSRLVWLDRRRGG